MKDGPSRAKSEVSTFAELDRSIHVLTGRQASDRQRQQFRTYLDMLVRWNRVQRLTGLREPAAIVQQLFQDSLLFLACIPSGTRAVADIGAGAGIPGIPLAIVRPDMSMTLIEAKRKRASFLRTVKRELNAQNISVIEGRAGQMASEAVLKDSFDVVVARAVGSLADLFPIAMGYLKAGGVFIASGPPKGVLRSGNDIPRGIERRAINIPELGSSRVFLTATKRYVDGTK
jgi:16S rRNA (guanine527-N7)-methyltransferase